MERGKLAGGYWRALAISVVAAGALCAAPSGASAAVEIGSNLNGNPEFGRTCAASGGCTQLQTALEASKATPSGIVSPINGIVVSYTVKSLTEAPPPAPSALPDWSFVHIRVAQSLGGDTFKGLAPTSPDVQPSTFTAVQTFPARLPIMNGQLVAFESDTPSANLMNFASATAASTVRYAEPKLPVNESGAATAFFANAEMLLKARIEADADNDGYGDETQDACPGNPRFQAPCVDPPPGSSGALPPQASPVAVANRRKCKKKRRGAINSVKGKCKRKK